MLDGTYLLCVVGDFWVALDTEYFKEFLSCWEDKTLTDNSWIVKIEDIKEFDISAKNPKTKEVIEHKSPM